MIPHDPELSFYEFQLQSLYLWFYGWCVVVNSGIRKRQAYAYASLFQNLKKENERKVCTMITIFEWLVEKSNTLYLFCKMTEQMAFSRSVTVDWMT